MQDAVHDGIAHVQLAEAMSILARSVVRRRELAGAHAFEQIEFSSPNGCVRALFAGLGEGAAMLATFIAGQIAT